MTTIAVHPIKTDADLEEATRRLWDLRGAPQDSEAWDEYMILADLIEAYEARHHPMPTVTGRAMLAHLMEEHGLTQSQVPEIGPQSLVSAILSGKRPINARMARALAIRFKVSGDAFLPE
jgi:HTH-type transcriptional regulator/antitoxin HigA